MVRYLVSDDAPSSDWYLHEHKRDVEEDKRNGQIAYFAKDSAGNPTIPAYREIRMPTRNP